MTTAAPDLAEELAAALVITGQTSAAPPDGTSASVTDAGATEVPADKGLQNPPAAQPHPEISFVPEDIRSEFASLSPRAVAFLKGEHDGVLLRGRFTQLTQELSDDRSAFEEEKKTLRHGAGMWQKLKENGPAYENLGSFLRSQQKQERGEAEPVEEDYSGVDLNDPAQRAAYDKRLLERAEKAGERRAESVIHKTFVEPREREKIASATYEQELVARRGLDAETAKRVARAHWISCNGVFDPKDVSGLVEPFVQLALSNKPAQPTPVEPLAPVTSAAQNGAAGPRRVATPSLGGGAIAPPPRLAHEREGRPPSGRDEFQDSVLRRMSEREGKEVTFADLDKALFSFGGNPAQ